jgi:serine/threonine-protein kinase RsbT
MDDEATLQIRSEHDILAARKQGRELAQRAGFAGSDLTLIATAISELARNIIEYAEHGVVSLSIDSTNGRRALVVVASDSGPGIPDVALAMQDGYSTGRSLGLGLPGAKRLMDEFEIQSDLGSGTTVRMRKWAGEPSLDRR